MGVGAWSSPPAYRQGMKLPSDSYQRQRWQWATVAIQRDLIRRGYLNLGPAVKSLVDRGLRVDPRLLPGGFGGMTKDAARRFQRDHDLDDDGVVGRLTGQALFWDWFVWHEYVDDRPGRRVIIPDHILAAMCHLESVFDPGAEGSHDAADRGIAQFNRRYWPQISDEIAFSRPDICIRQAAFNLREAYDDLDDWDLAIAHHNNPAKAYEWKRLGHAPDEQIETYVRLVRRRAAEFS